MGLTACATGPFWTLPDNVSRHAGLAHRVGDNDGPVADVVPVHGPEHAVQHHGEVGQGGVGPCGGEAGEQTRGEEGRNGSFWVATHVFW